MDKDLLERAKLARKRAAQEIHKEFMQKVAAPTPDKKDLPKKFGRGGYGR